MSVQPIVDTLSAQRAQLPVRELRWRSRVWRRSWPILRWPLLIVLALSLLGSSVLPAEIERSTRIGALVSDYQFNFAGWEIAAIREKLTAQIEQPASALLYPASASLVKEYLARAREIRTLEREITGILSENGDQQTDETLDLQSQVDGLRAEQQPVRATVEQIVEAQIGRLIVNEGIEFAGRPFPPVLFAFTEPPKKLIVSPRERITAAYSQMLDESISLEEIGSAEQSIEQQDQLSAYITNIGGLGAYPSMVLDRADLPWILSTVAHEWTHNYLTLFPLGLLYNANHDLTTINETVAEIVGDELGLKAQQMYYPESLPPADATAESSTPAAEEPPAFDFNAEMRHTRETVDKFLALGLVDEAEKYMELRRLLFVENGFPLRKLNQAYFAFHGSYGTSAASTSPIGPKLERLRELTPDLHTFLRAVRGITSAEKLDEVMAEWEVKSKQ